MQIRGRLIFLLLNLLIFLAAAPAFSQGEWTADLFFDPYPSPYLSDWENNPSTGQAFITNGTASTVSVRIFLSLSHDTRGKIATANSRVFDCPPGPLQPLGTPDLIDDGSINYDQSVEDIAVRTGRLPEGRYRICLQLRAESGQVLLDNVCAEFTILYPDPPYLIYPSDGETIFSPYPVFQWMPVQTPIGFPVHYNLQIAEVMEDQSPAHALAANFLQYRDPNVTTTSAQYPIDALPLQKGKTYAWQVQVLDDRGYPPSANNGRSEVWMFVCDIDTTTPIELRELAGHAVDSVTGTSLDSVRVVYRPVHRTISGNDTSWTEGADSLVRMTDGAGAFLFDSAFDHSYFSLTATRNDYTPVRLAGQELYQNGNIRNFTIRLPQAPPGTRRLAGVLRDFYSNQPVPNAAVVYHAVDMTITTDSSGASHFSYSENPRRKLETITDAAGRFEFLQAADSSFFSLRASLSPAYLLALDIGPNQRQVRDIDDYIFLIKPNAGNITGTLRTMIGGKTEPVARAIVQLTRVAQVSVRTTFLGLTTESTEVVTDSANMTAYSNAAGFFRMNRISQEKPSTVENKSIRMFFFDIPMRTTTTVLSYSYRIAVNDPRYRPYVSADSIVVLPGETTESGEHLLTPRSGSIVGRIVCDTSAVEGARVSLYKASYRTRDREATVAAQVGRADTGLVIPGAAGDSPSQSENMTWGEANSQRPSGEPLDVYETGGDGVYAFSLVPINDPQQATERYTVWVEADGFNPAQKGNRLEAEAEVDTVDFTVTPMGGVIYGKVKSGAGALLSNVRVELRRHDSTESGTTAWLPNPAWVVSGGDGDYSFGDIEPGLYRMQFSKSGFTTLTTDTIPIDYGNRLLYDADLSAAKGFVLLDATDKNGSGLSDVCVKSDQISSLIGFTERDGRILITDAPADTVTLKLRKLGYADLDTTILVAADDTAKVSVKLSRSVGQVLVRVVEKGSPEKRLAGMTVKIGKTESGKKPDSTLTKTTGSNGEVVFPEAPAGQQTIIVSPPDDTDYALDYVIVETQAYIYTGLNAEPLIVEMEPAARMQGSVTNKEGGAPLDSVTVSVEGNANIKALTNLAGEFSLRNVPPGRSLTLVAKKCGFKSARFTYGQQISVGDKITGIRIELEKSPMDSLFGFPIALDSVKAGANGNSRVWGTLLEVPPTFGMKLRDGTATLSFADLEVDSIYRPTSDSLTLVQREAEVNIFGIDAKMLNEGGLHLQWVDSVKAGRISGSLKLSDPISKIFPETEFIDLTIPKRMAPSFWAGGVNHGLDRFGLTSTNQEVQVKIKSVTVGLDFNKSNLDTAGLHLFGTIQFGSSFSVGFEEMIIGKDASGEVAFKSISIRTTPAIKIPFGVFTVVDSAMTWEATGFRASGAIVLNALDNREFGFKDLRISPQGEFLSLTVTADEENGTISVHGQKFQIEKLEFGTENFTSENLEHTKYFAFAGKLTISKLDKPVGMNLRYTEKGLFTGKLEINQSRSFGGVVTISLESIELGYDSTRADRFVGFSGGVKFGAIKGLNLQASNLRFYLAGGVSFDEMAMDFLAGPVQVKVSVAYNNAVFEGKGWFEVKPVVTAGAEFRYGGPEDWWVRIISGTRIPIGPCEIVQASGGIGRKDDVWRFSIGGVVAPAKADKGIRLDLLVEVQKTPQGVIILGNANVDVASGTQIGRATIEINTPEKRISGSIVFGIDYKALQATAQLDLCVKFDEYWYVYGRANIDVLKFFKSDGIIIVANNWQWQHDGQTTLMSGIYIELNSMFKVDADWFVIKWGVNLDRHAMVYIGWNGDFSGKIDMAGGAYAWIGFGPFDLIQARAAMALAAHLSYLEPEWSAGARGHFSLQGSIGWCGNANCWTICWKCFIRIFGRCIFALPTGAKACIGMNAYIEYATSKGMTWDISF